VTNHRLDQKGVESDGTPLSQDDIEMWRAAEEQESKERAETFDQLLNDLAEDRVWLKTHEQTFKDLRNKHIAHLEVQTGEAGVYEIVSPKGPTWGVMKEALQRLVRIAENLLTLVLDKSKSFDEEQELFKRDADAFWKGGANIQH
jgi:AbiU2